MLEIKKKNYICREFRKKEKYSDGQLISFYLLIYLKKEIGID